MGYVYNADDTGEGSTGYGAAPPAVGFQVITGPVGLPNGHDDDGDDTIDEPGERLALHDSAWFNNGVGTGDPFSGVEDYRYLRGLWRDGSVIRAFGNGYVQTQGEVTRYAYPGDPVMGALWSELNNGFSPTPDLPGDRRMVVSTGPFRLAPGASVTVTFSILYSRGESNPDSITRLRALARTVRTAYATIEPTAVVEPTPPAVTLSRPFQPDVGPGRRDVRDARRDAAPRDVPRRARPRGRGAR